VVVDHPEHDVVDGTEAIVLDGAKFDAVLAADVVAVVAIDQHIAPQHQGVAASFGQQRAFQGGVFIGCERIDEGTQFLIDGDIQSGVPRCKAVRIVHHGRAGVLESRAPPGW